MSSHATGPRSDAGKERSSRNALQHGLCSERPVLPGEDPAAWDAFHADAVRELRPVGTLESELADRVALQLWRLRRAARYEAQVAGAELEAVRHANSDPCADIVSADAAEQAVARSVGEVQEVKDHLRDALAAREAIRRLPSQPAGDDIDQRVALGLIVLAGGQPHDLPEPPTAAALRQRLSSLTGQRMAEALRQVQARVEARCQELADEAARRGGRLIFHQEQRHRDRQAREFDRQLLQAQALDRVVRYEAHVSRQLNQALHLLRQLQAERRAAAADHGAAASPAPVAQPAPAPVPMPSAANTTRSFGNPERAPSTAVPDDAHGLPGRAPSAVPVGDPFVRQTAQRNGVVAGTAPPAAP